MSRPRVLLIAEAANPEWVSVPLVGWSHARALADVADVHLVTQVRNAEAIRRAGLHDFTAIDSEPIAGRAWKLASRLRGGEGRGWTTVSALATLGYYEFERRLWRRFARRIADRQFDLVHRLTPLSPTTPSIIAPRCARAGVPFILGPLNGGLPWPRQFDSARRREREWLSYVRLAHRLLPGHRSTLRHAAAILVGSRATLEQIPPAFRDKCIYLPENAVDPARFSRSVQRDPAPPLRVAFVGRLVPYKGADMLIDAAAPLLRDGRLLLDIIGDGPEMPMLRDMVRRQGLERGVHLGGWVEHARVQDRLLESDVLGFPSIREFGGAVVLEAMALGLAPVIVDYGGPAELVTPETGFAVPLGTRAEVVEGFRLRLEMLADRPGVARETGRRARERVMECFTWNTKARQTREVYDWVLGRREAKPGFGMPLRGTGARTCAVVA